MKNKLLSQLNHHPWANHIHWFDTIDSTNTAAKKMGLAGAPSGTILIADRQTGGRGRMGRSFCSPPGVGIYMSVILRPNCKAAELMHLTCATAVAMCDAIEKVSGFRPAVKWINDLIANGKKLGGILTELALIPGTDQVDFAIVGVGINCNHETEDFPPELRNIAISLKAVTGIVWDRAQLSAAMVDAFYHMDKTLLSEKEATMTQYRADCCTLGQDIYLLRGEERTACYALDLDLDGALIVRFADGTEAAINSGEVSVRQQ